MNAPLIHPFARAGNSSQLLLPVLCRAPLGNLSRNVCVYTGPKVTRGGRKAATPGRCIPSFLSGERRRTNEPSFAKGGGRLRRLVSSFTHSGAPPALAAARRADRRAARAHACLRGPRVTCMRDTWECTHGMHISRSPRPWGSGSQLIASLDLLFRTHSSLARILREFGSELSRIRGLCWRHISNCGEISRNRYRRAEYVNRAEYFV